MNNRILEAMIGIPELRVLGVRPDFENKEFHIDLQWKSEFCDCRGCGRKGAAKVIKREPRAESVRHLDCLGFKTLLYFDKLEMKCSTCGALFNMPTLFLTQSRFLSDALVDDLMRKTRDTSVSAVAGWTGESERTIQSIYYRELGSRDESKTVPAVKRLGIDEISLLKGHGSYVTILYDLERHEVIDVLPERTKEVLTAYLREHQEGIFAGLQVVSMDMCQIFRDSVKAVFPNVDIVADRFHVERHLCEMLDERRLDVARKVKDPEEKRKWKKEYRYALLRAYSRQLDREDGFNILAAVLRHDPELSRLYHLKEDFRDILSLPSYDKAKPALNNWLRKARYLGSKYLEGFIGTVTRWKEEILGYAKHGLSNGPCEGINCKIKLIKRMGYGFPNFANFRLRILHTCSQMLV